MGGTGQERATRARRFSPIYCCRPKLWREQRRLLFSWPATRSPDRTTLAESLEEQALQPISNIFELGSTVSVGQTICIIEAMKVMNEIKAERSGTN